MDVQEKRRARVLFVLDRKVFEARARETAPDERGLDEVVELRTRDFVEHIANPNAGLPLEAFGQLDAGAPVGVQHGAPLEGDSVVAAGDRSRIKRRPRNETHGRLSTVLGWHVPGGGEFVADGKPADAVRSIRIGRARLDAKKEPVERLYLTHLAQGRRREPIFHERGLDGDAQLAHEIVERRLPRPALPHERAAAIAFLPLRDVLGDVLVEQPHLLVDAAGPRRLHDIERTRVEPRVERRLRRGDVHKPRKRVGERDAPSEADTR